MTDPATDWHRPAGTAARDGDPVVVGPEDAGWTYCGLRVVRLAPGEVRDLASGPDEIAVLPLTGGGVRVEAEGRSFRLAGRDSVFARVTDWAYVPIDAEVRLANDAGGAGAAVEVALASARATRRFDPAHVEAGDVAVEVRGAGPATRQVTNFMAPDAFDGADKLMCVELLTPDGNWSSYPPHKHDGTDGCPVTNEEIYYFRIAPPDGFALHRTYTTDGAVDVNVTVHDGDVFLIPLGYHGPCVAAPGHPLYYLNVLAGPGPERTMAFCDDPAHHWVRSTWNQLPTDPRCPLTSAEGVVRP
jgi:5-deoxy-glucuronate isomerase